MGASLVFFDIVGPDLASQSRFYSEIFGWKIARDGGFSVSVASPLPANLRVEQADKGPITERVVYLGVDDATATLNKITAHGGSVVFPRFVVPGKVVVGLFKDPAGNRMGLIEMKDGKVVVPPAR
ncbi:MAG TPA: VOC family protein [Alphaproteobacteria bacterium]|nr:VOC family protein [Alphaproteobacteria bacterium]